MPKIRTFYDTKSKNNIIFSFKTKVALIFVFFSFHFHDSNNKTKYIIYAYQIYNILAPIKFRCFQFSIKFWHGFKTKQNLN